MKMNGLSLLVTVILMAAALWLVNALSEIQKNQDCYLSGEATVIRLKFVRPSYQPPKIAGYKRSHSCPIAATGRL